MTFGVTPTGYNRKTFNDILTSLETKLRESYGAPRLNVRDPKGLLASLVFPFTDELSQVHEMVEIVYNMLDAQRSTGQAYSAVASLSGALRKLANIGTHAGITFTFDDAVAGTVERGDVRFSPENDPDNVWINSESFLIASANDYLIAVESESAGSSKTLEASTTIDIISGPAELSAITVATDAVPGTDLETESAWRARREASLQAQGTTPIDALTAEVEDVDGVVNARIVETAGYIRVIIADGGGDADDDAVAQAIWDGKAGGVITLGSSSGTAIDRYGQNRTVKFERANETDIHVIIIVIAPEGASEAEIKSALRGAMPTRSGDPVVWAKLHAAVMGVDGVTDITSLLIGTVDPPAGTTNITIASTDLAALIDANIDVTVS